MILKCSGKHLQNSARSDFIFVLLMIVSMVIWGGSWVSAKVMAVRLEPEVLCFWRFFLSFVSLLPVILVQRPTILTWQGLWYGLLGSIFMSGYMYFFFKGLEHELAGAAGVLVTSMIPLMTLLFSLFFFRKKAGSRDFAGLALGMLGAAILLKLWDLNLNVLLHSGNLIFLLCAALWALLTISSQQASQTISPYLFSLISYGISSLFFLPSALSRGIGEVFRQDMLFWANLIFLSVLSAGFATTVYFIAAERLGSYRTSSYVFLVPTSAVLLSLIFLGEIPTHTTMIGGAVAVSAVYVINHSQRLRGCTGK